MKLADIVEMNATSVIRYNDRINRVPKTAVVELFHADGSKAGSFSPKEAWSFLALLRKAVRTLPGEVNQDQRWSIRTEPGGYEIESGTIMWPPRWRGEG